MTQENKQLLLKDLLPRIPFLVKIKLGDYDYQVCGYDPTNSQPVRIFFYKNDVKYYASIYVKDYCPYLRPMSSMTEEEREEYLTECDKDAESTLSAPHHHGIDWLNRKMFDYRTVPDENGEEKTMIELGWALEAPDGMYEKEEQQ